MVVPAVQSVQRDVAELGAPRTPMALPGRVEVRRQRVADGCIFDAQHQIVPGEIVIAEIYPSQIGRIIRDDELLVVSESEANQERPGGVGHPDADAGRRHRIEHAARRPKLGAKIGIEEIMREDKAVADGEARVVVHQHAPIPGRAGHDAPADAEARLIAFEGHGLDQQPPPGLGHVRLGRRHEGSRSHQERVFRQGVLRPVAILACAVAQIAPPQLEAAHA